MQPLASYQPSTPLVPSHWLLSRTLDIHSTIIFLWEMLGSVLLIPYNSSFYRFHRKLQLTEIHLDGALNYPELGFCCLFFLLLP